MHLQSIGGCVELYIVLNKCVTWVSVLVVIFASVACERKISPPTVSKEPDAIEEVTTSFVPEAVLTKREIQDLVQLADQCGVKRVSQIRTYYIHPSSNCGIQIKSVEAISGRKVSFVTINLRYKDPYDNDRIGDAVASVGDFKVRAGRISTDLLTTFSTRTGMIRVRLADDVPLVTADRIVELFAKGRVRYRDESSARKLHEIDLSKPQSLEYGKDKGSFMISFAIGEYGCAWLDFTLETDEVVVSKAQEIMS